MLDDTLLTKMPAKLPSTEQIFTETTFDAPDDYVNPFSYKKYSYHSKRKINYHMWFSKGIGDWQTI